MQRLIDPGFETGEGWTLAPAGAGLTAEFGVRGGSRALALSAGRNIDSIDRDGHPVWGPPYGGSATQVVPPAATGAGVLTVWARCVAPQATLRLDVGPASRTLVAAAAEPSWRRLAVPVALGVDPLPVSFAASFTGAPGDVGLWLLDDARLDEVSIHVAVREALLDRLRAIDGSGAWRSRPAGVYAAAPGQGVPTPSLFLMDDDRAVTPRTLGPAARATGSITFWIEAVSHALEGDAPELEIDAMVCDVERAVGETPDLQCPPDWGVRAAVSKVEVSRGSELAGRSLARITVQADYVYRGAQP